MLRTMLSYFTVGGTTIEHLIRDVENALVAVHADNFDYAELEASIAKYKGNTDLFAGNYIGYYEELLSTVRADSEFLEKSKAYINIAGDTLYGLHTLLQKTFMTASRDEFATFDKVYTDNTNIRHLTQIIVDTVIEHVVATKDAIITLDDENNARITRDVANIVDTTLRETYDELTKEADVLYTHIAEQLQGLISIDIYRHHSTNLEDLLETSSNIQTILLKSPFSLPAELFVIATSKEMGEWVEQLGEQIGNVYKEYISPDRITNAFNHSDIVVEAISNYNTQNGVAKLKALEKSLLTYEGVYQGVVDSNLSGGRNAYEDDVDDDPDVIVERERITNMLIEVFDIDKALFQAEEHIESEAIVRAKAQEMSIWLNLMPTRTAGNQTYNNSFVDSIVTKTSYHSTAPDLAREHWDNFRVAYHAMQENKLSTPLIAMMEQFARTSPALDNVIKEPISTDNLKEIVRDWLTEMQLVDPNILAHTTTTKTDMKASVSSIYSNWSDYNKDLFFVTKEISSMFLLANDINKRRRPNVTTVAVVNPFGKLSSSVSIEYFVERIKKLSQPGKHASKNTADEIAVLENAHILAGQLIEPDKVAWKSPTTSNVATAITSSKRISTLKASLQNNGQNKYLQYLETYHKLQTEHSNLLRASTVDAATAKEIETTALVLERLENQLKEVEGQAAVISKEIKVIFAAQSEQYEIIKLLKDIKVEINGNLNSSKLQVGARAFEVLNFGVQIKRLFDTLDELDSNYKSWLTGHLRSDSSMEISPILLRLDRTVKELSKTYSEAKKVYDEKVEFKGNLKQSLNELTKSIAAQQVIVGRNKVIVDKAAQFSKAAEAKSKELDRHIGEMKDHESTLLLTISGLISTLKSQEISISPDYVAVLTNLLQ